MQSIHQSPKRSRGGQGKSPQSTAVRPELVRARYEHYRGLAESTRDIDRVTRENYWQHAEHFLRMLTEHDVSLMPRAPHNRSPLTT